MKSAYYCRANSYSRSYNAHVAEAEGRMPATRAAKAWGFKSAAELRRWVTTSEWHHVGKFANAVDYFDTDGWITELESHNAMHEGGVFAEIAGLSKSLTREGRKTTLPHIVGRIVRENLTTAAPSRHWEQNRKHVSRRRAELELRHGLNEFGVRTISFSAAKGFDLSDRGAVIFAAKAKEAAAAAQREKVRKNFPAKMKANLTPAPAGLSQNDRDSRWRKRFDQVVEIFGNRYNSNAVRRHMRKNSLSLTLANYRQTFEALRA